MKNSLLLVFLLVLVGCATSGRNPLQGRQDEFDARIAAARERAADAPSPARDLFDSQHIRCLQFQRTYVFELNDARAGYLTPMELRGFEHRFNREIRWLERLADDLRRVQ